MLTITCLSISCISGKTFKIVDIDFARASLALDEEYLRGGFQTGPGNQMFYSTSRDDNDFLPEEMHHGTYNNIPQTLSVSHKITAAKWAELNITDPNTPNNPFRGFFGLGFSPNANNKDSGTGHGYMVGTAPYGFWQVGLEGTPAAYDPVVNNTKLLCSLPGSNYPSGMGFIPSGSKKDGVMFADFDHDTIQILPLDYTTKQNGTTGLCINNSTGQPELGTDNPRLYDFTWYVSEPSGFMFDPRVSIFKMKSK